MKTMKKRYSRIMILLLFAALSAYAGNKLTIARTATNILEIQLANSEKVCGIQFSLHTSSDIALKSVEKGGLTSEPHWYLASYKPNDSTVNVIIISMALKSLTNGQGTLAKISFSTDEPFENSYASLTNVMITNEKADSLGVSINNLAWNNESILASSNGEPKYFALGQNFPNPFNPTTRIAYRLNKAAQVRLSIYDITGREVSRLIDQYQYVGEYNVEWNSTGRGGQLLASGMYFARLSVDNESVTRKMVMSK